LKDLCLHCYEKPQGDCIFCDDCLKWYQDWYFESLMDHIFALVEWFLGFDEPPVPTFFAFDFGKGGSLREISKEEFFNLSMEEVKK